MKLNILSALIASAFLLSACGEDTSTTPQTENKVTVASPASVTQEPTTTAASAPVITEKTEDVAQTDSMPTAKVDTPKEIVKQAVEEVIVATPKAVPPPSEIKPEPIPKTIETPKPETVVAAELPKKPITGDASLGQSAYGSCIGCHGAAGEGGVGPKLAGADPKSTIEKLTKYKNGETLGPMTGMMAPMALSLSEADMANIAEYVAGL